MIYPLRGFNCFLTRSHTLSQYPRWIQPGQFPSENLVRKITPRWKWFEFCTSPTILHKLVHSGKNLESLMVHSDFFSILPGWDLILPLWHYLVLGVWQHLVRITVIRDLFPQNIRLYFQVMIDWFLFAFTDFLLWAGNWILSIEKSVNKNSLAEECPYSNLGLTRLSYINIFQNSRSQWSTLRYVD